MPLRSFSALRRWLTPWAWAAIVLMGLVFALAGPPLELWPSMLATALVTLLGAGILTALLFSAGATLLRMPLGSRGAYVLAALAGATVPLLPVTAVLFDALFSMVVFAALGLIAAWRLAPADVTALRAQSLGTPARTS
jgi:hypothetical protein